MIDQPVGEIAGRITTPDGRPVADAAVMIGGGSPPHPDIAALSDADGRFRFAGLPPGAYTLIVNAEGWPQQQVSANLTGEHTTVNIVLGSG